MTTMTNIDEKPEWTEAVRDYPFEDRVIATVNRMTFPEGGLSSADIAARMDELDLLGYATVIDVADVMRKWFR